jgi:hypothetical protein
MPWHSFKYVLSKHLQQLWSQLLRSQGKQKYLVDKGMSKSLGTHKVEIF